MLFLTEKWTLIFTIWGWKYWASAHSSNILCLHVLGWVFEKLCIKHRTWSEELTDGFNEGHTDSSLSCDLCGATEAYRRATDPSLGLKYVQVVYNEMLLCQYWAY